jgi:hypothetical protein
MLPVALTPRRKLALALALAWWVPSSAFFMYRLHFGTAPPLLHWPFAVTAAWTLASALATGVIVVECVRVSFRAPASWSDKRHFAFALVVALACLIVQWVSLVLASQGGTRAF